MERVELARLLGAPAGLVAEPGREPIVVQEADPARFMAAFAAAVARGGPVMLASEGWKENEHRQLAELRALPAVTPAAALGKGWLCIPTGGSGGKVKLARHDEDTIAAAVRGFCSHFQITQVNAVGLLPLHHVSGLMAWMRCALTGGEYRPLDWKAVEAGALPALPVQPQGWVISLVPTQLERLLRRPDAVAWLQGFRVIFLGGAPVWPALLEQALVCGLPVSPGYGMTETAAMVTALTPAEFLLGSPSNGTVLPHATVRIGEDGVVRVGGDSLFRGYHPEWRERAEFATGDLGRFDEGQHLHVLGRRDAVIITGGEKVDPAEVEGVLRGTGLFSEVMVLGLPDEEWGQVVVAAYPATATPDLGRVGEALRRLLPAFKHPKHYVALSQFPLTSQGKINRAEVKRMVQEQQDSDGSTTAR